MVDNFIQVNPTKSNNLCLKTANPTHTFLGLLPRFLGILQHVYKATYFYMHFKSKIAS